MVVKSPALTNVFSLNIRKEAISLETVYDTYAPGLYRYALAITRSEADAEDAVQDVFSRIARRSSEFAKTRSPRAYLYSAVRNACLNLLKHRKRSDGANVDVGADDKANDSNHLLVRYEMLKLPIDQREVIILKVYDGMSFEEISAVLEINKNTAASRYRYGIDRLRKALEETDEI
ncbi:MAG: RNA polymerase sigma factor [Armatimonadota bacterium]